jgi:ATP-dependent Clp protease ATP-binding subunit ClpA
MFERFEPDARQAVTHARQEAGWAGQDKIRSEHMLLGLLREPGIAADALIAAGLDVESVRRQVPQGGRYLTGELDGDALATLGIDLDAVRRATDAAFGPGALDRAPVPGRSRPPFADDAKQVLVGAVRGAQHEGRRTISSGHMLLGILDQPRSSAVTVLKQSGADLPALRADVLRRLTTPA